MTNCNVVQDKVGVVAPVGIYSTRDMYKLQNVSFGTAWTAPLADNTKIVFSAGRLKNFSKFDERNLKFCHYLSLLETSITSIETVHLFAVRVLCIAFCDI